MSSLIVPVAEIESIQPHPNADRLQLATILGWQVVVGKDQYQPGQSVVYFPPDTVLPDGVADLLGVSKYLSNGRVRCAKLRGEPSFGFATAPTREWPIGENVAAAFGATKYEPPLRPTEGDVVAEHPLLARYTEIENLRNFPHVLREGEEVVVTEKIHGANSRLALLGGANGELVAGSRKLQRGMPPAGEMARNLYWFPYTVPGVAVMLEQLAKLHRQVVLFGEVFGKVQSLHYGMPGALGYRAFDLLIDGRYIGHEDFEMCCEYYDVPTVPMLARGPYSLEWVRELSAGKTMLGDNHIREGVVVRPTVERTDPKVGRVVLKYINDAYLFGEQTDFTEA